MARSSGHTSEVEPFDNGDARAKENAVDCRHLVVGRRNGRTVDADRADTAGCEILRCVRSDRYVRLEEHSGPTPRRISGLEQQSLAGAYTVRSYFFSGNDMAVPNHNYPRPTDRGIYRQHVNGPTALHEMERGVDMCAGMSAHGQRRERTHVASRDIVHARQLERRITGPRHQTVSQPNRDINPARHLHHYPENTNARCDPS